ncbi:MAG: hypothetical protein GEV07_10735 [Streptosporangiales bacterium]|nr:hypothetical protein [Streptosporangiales bacterium]
MRILMVLALIGLAVVFVVSFVRPRESREVQERLKRYTKEWAEKARGRGDRAGERTAETIEKMGHTTQRVEHAGRKAHDKVFRSSAGAGQERALERRYGEGAERGEE